TDFYTSDGGSTPPSPTSVSDKTPSSPLSALNSCTKLHLRRGALPPRRVAGVVGTWAGHRSVFSEPLVRRLGLWGCRRRRQRIGITLLACQGSARSRCYSPILSGPRSL